MLNLIRNIFRQTEVYCIIVEHEGPNSCLYSINELANAAKKQNKNIERYMDERFGCDKWRPFGWLTIESLRNATVRKEGL